MKNVLVLTYWSYNEPLVQSGALPYLKLISKNLPAGSKLFLFTLDKPNYTINTIEQRNIITEELSKYNIIMVDRKYYPFGFKTLITLPFYMLELLYIILFKKIKFIHAFCSPAGTIGYLLSKITRIPLIIDSYEPHAESMVENGVWKKSSLAYRILFFFEKKQAIHAHSVISLSEGMKRYTLEKYGVINKQFFVRSTCVDLGLFDLEKINAITIENLKFKLNYKTEDIICVYAGKIGGIYLEDELFDFFNACINFWNEKFKILLLTDLPNDKLLHYLKKHKINQKFIYSAFVPYNEMRNYLSLATFAICAVKPLPTKRFCSPIKNGEYWAMGLPVVIPNNIGDDSELIENKKIGVVLNQLTLSEYNKCILNLNQLIFTTDKSILKKSIISIAKENRNIVNYESIYKSIYS